MSTTVSTGPGCLHDIHVLTRFGLAMMTPRFGSRIRNRHEKRPVRAEFAGLPWRGFCTAGTSTTGNRQNLRSTVRSVALSLGYFGDFGPSMATFALLSCKFAHHFTRQRASALI